MNWNEVQECLLNDGQEIMLWEDVLPKIKDWFRYVFLDFKIWEGESCPQNKWKIFEEVLTLVQKNKMDAKVIFSSYDENVSKFLWTKWNIISALDTYSLDRLDDIPWSYFSYFMTPSDNFSDTLVKQLQMKWIESVAYVVNDPTVFQKLASRWVRFVMTDEISKLKKAIQK
jgi:glycerophosphoryl diester phosphodiesterase